MYLRYGDLSWEVVDPAQEQQPQEQTASAAAARRRRYRPGWTFNARHGHRLPTVQLNGVELHAITEAGCIEHVIEELKAGRGGMVVTPNLDHLRRCMHDMSFSALVAEADLVVADGMPLVWASRLQGTPLPERVAGSDLVSSLSAAAAEYGLSIFLLGGAPGTAEAAAKVLQERHPNLQITGIHCPPYGFEKDEVAIGKIAEMLVTGRPRIIYVALGSPKQELLIHQLRQFLPDSWWLGVGNSFSFLSGEVRRAPVWMQRHGLEWLHRLIQEPKRLFRRYIIVGVPFASRLLGRSLLRGLPARFRASRAQEHVSGEQAGTPEGNGAFWRSLPEPHPQPLAVPPSGNGNGATAGGANGSTTTRNGHLASRLSGRSTTAPPLERLRALVLLGGSVRPNPLINAIGRSVMDLPLDDEGTILNHWLHHAGDLARQAQILSLPIRFMVDQHSPEPASLADGAWPLFRVERDRSEYRGTGGVLHDLAMDYADDDLILVANAAQVLLEPLSAIARALQDRQGDVSLVAHQDGTPSGIMLVSCAALRLIPEAGFVDMKEQALPEIARRFDVTVMNGRRPTGLPVRSLADYIAALRRYHRSRIGKPAGIDPLAEDWRPAFAIVEDGADVDPLARVHDSVVLRGARVEQGAVLVRSIVCPGGVVRRDRTAVDQFVRDPADTSAGTLPRNR